MPENIHLTRLHAKSFLDKASFSGILAGYLEETSPHGKALPAFFVVFVAAMAAMRVLIAWFYERTQSIALAQLVHLSSTGALVVFSQPTVSPLQEATWYALYAAALWLLVLLLTTILPPATQPTER